MSALTTGLLTLMLVAAASAQYSIGTPYFYPDGTYYSGGSYYYGNGSDYYSFDYYYDHYHHEECEMNVPEGLSVPSMCFLYLFVGECQEMGYDAHNLEEYRSCMYEMLPEEEQWYIDDEMWYSDFGPGGEQVNDLCSQMGYDISTLNHYAVCLEHMFGVGYDASNEAFLGVEIDEEVPEIIWDWYDYYSYNPDYKVGPPLPADPIERILALLHGMAAEFLPGYNMCPYDEYMCSDGSCIPHYWKCDAYPDCWDGTDELFCGFDWEDEWYGCYIDEWQWCDGWQDCAYDENYCDYYHWDDDYHYYGWDDDYHYYGWYGDYDFEEAEWYGCYIEEWEWCDGFKDCAFDEANWCDDYNWNYWETYEQDPWYQCDIDEYQWCDGVKDCAFDETQWCDVYYGAVDEDDDWYYCYIAEWEWCDGWKDCAFDEASWCDDYNWNYWQTYEQDPWFQCDIEDDQWCNGVEDCAFDETEFCDLYNYYGYYAYPHYSYTSGYGSYGSGYGSSGSGYGSSGSGYGSSGSGYGNYGGNYGTYRPYTPSYPYRK